MYIKHLVLLILLSLYNTGHCFAANKDNSFLNDLLNKYSFGRGINSTDTKIPRSDLENDQTNDSHKIKNLFKWLRENDNAPFPKKSDPEVTDELYSAAIENVMQGTVIEIINCPYQVFLDVNLFGHVEKPAKPSRIITVSKFSLKQQSGYGLGYKEISSKESFLDNGKRKIEKNNCVMSQLQDFQQTSSRGRSSMGCCLKTDEKKEKCIELAKTKEWDPGNPEHYLYVPTKQGSFSGKVAKNSCGYKS